MNYCECCNGVWYWKYNENNDIIENLKIPNHIKYIGRQSIWANINNCSRIKGVTIPRSAEIVDPEAFFKCSGLEWISVESGNTRYHSNGNCLIDTDSKVLVAGCKNSTIPTDGSVTSIGDCAFYWRYLDSISLPEEITSIGNFAFLDCHNLKTIMIPDGVKDIGTGAFINCRNLRSIKIPRSVDTLGDEVFYGCDKLTKIYISRGPMKMGYNIFGGLKEHKITLEYIKR